jgi:hypothetical protein
MSTKHYRADCATATVDRPRLPSTRPAPIDLLQDPPAVYGDLSAHVELDDAAAQRLTEVLEGDDGPTPAMLALFERYGWV